LGKDAAPSYLVGAGSLPTPTRQCYPTAALAGLGTRWLLDYTVHEQLARAAQAQLFDDWQIDTVPLSLS
jgi:hypothetical protein